jgi:exopolysaccharide biosynthesis polyprenyl glycosylphosphotransferase
VAALFAVGLIASKGLYRARTCSVRAAELAALWRVATVLMVAELADDRLFGIRSSLNVIMLRGFLTLALLVLFRSGYRQVLRSARRRGRFGRSVVIVGTNEHAVGLHRTLSEHPEDGFHSCGLVGERRALGGNREVPWLGEAEATLDVVRATGSTGVIVVGGALEKGDLNLLVRGLLKAKVHVQMSSGLEGIASHRLRTSSLGKESLLYLEPASLTPCQLSLKRMLDVVLASVLLLVSLPFILVSAVAIKLESGGPVFFKQERVGRQGKRFTIYKLRTMVPGAHDQLAQLTAHNVRSGPLFKMERDPRITRVGRFLRGSSIDELPQLLNVLLGAMSLVGPRPALPEEVAQFDSRLLARLDVQPGLTGLWQVEARDDPDFSKYQSLDLYYVENWAVMLDLTILLCTMKVVIGRAARTVHRPAATKSNRPVPAVVLS